MCWKQNVATRPPVVHSVGTAWQYLQSRSTRGIGMAVQPKSVHHVRYYQVYLHWPGVWFQKHLSWARIDRKYNPESFKQSLSHIEGTDADFKMTPTKKAGSKHIYVEMFGNVICVWKPGILTNVQSPHLGHDAMQYLKQIVRKLSVSARFWSVIFQDVGKPIFFFSGSIPKGQNPPCSHSHPVSVPHQRSSCP